eukprot:4178395-Alexandrium_andersonii.AAC.1
MSASLVGSEMCIRDRPCSLASSCRAPSRPPTGTCSCASPGRLAPLPQPVSYTHLTLPTICSV